MLVPVATLAGFKGVVNFLISCWICLEMIASSSPSLPTADHSMTTEVESGSVAIRRSKHKKYSSQIFFQNFQNLYESYGRLISAQFSVLADSTADSTVCNRSGVSTGPEVDPGCSLDYISDDSSLS